MINNSQTTSALTLTLDLALHPGEIPAFRAACAKAAGGHVLFHGHIGEDDTAADRSWDYPLVQYSVRRGQATVVGIGEGLQAIRTHLLPNLPEQWNLNGRIVTSSEYQVQKSELVFKNEPTSFGLVDWMALKPENYQLWKANTNEQYRLELLNACLYGHMQAVARAVQGSELTDLSVQITSLHRQKKITWHNTDLILFDVLATANYQPLLLCGLGRAVSFGFGQAMPEYDYMRFAARRQQHKSQISDIL